MNRLKVIVLVAVLLFPFVGSAQAFLRNNSESRTDIEKIGQFFYFLDRAYVEPVQNKELIETAIKAVLAKLDPHSVYISAEEMKSVNESFEGNFEGIGIEFNVLNDTLIVVNTIMGGPSERVGLKPNDRIIAVNDSSIIGITQLEVPKILRGPKGTRIDVRVVRRGERSPLDFTIERDKIPMNSVDAVYQPDPQTGYIKINRFSATTAQEFIDGIRSMPGITNLILDLRGNGGGYMDQAIILCEQFLPEGALLVYTEGRQSSKQEAFSEGGGVYTRGRVIVLVDEESASASEIVSGAIQDWDRGLIIGRRTFGKGLVQSQIPLLDGSAIRLTVARYHTPSGRVIQRPYELGQKEKYYMDFIDRYKSGELTGTATDTVRAEIPDSLKFHTLRSNRLVFGGGGITPDIIVPLDTTGYSTYWSTLVRRGVMLDFVVDYMDKNRTSLERNYPTFESFETGFRADEALLEQLVAFGEQKGVVRDTAGLQQSSRMMRIQLKALIAQKLWDNTEYYRVINKESDREYARALDVLRDWETYSEGIYSN